MTRQRLVGMGLGLVVAAGVLVWWVANRAQAQAAPARATLLINLTAGKEDLHKATMALQLAAHGLDDARKVVVFLNVRAAEFAARAASDRLTFGKNPPVPEMLRELIRRGAVVEVCPTCVEAVGLKPGDLIEGAKLTSRQALFGHLGPSCDVFSY